MSYELKGRDDNWEDSSAEQTNPAQTRPSDDIDSLERTRPRIWLDIEPTMEYPDDFDPGEMFGATRPAIPRFEEAIAAQANEPPIEPSVESLLIRVTSWAQHPHEASFEPSTGAARVARGTGTEIYEPSGPPRRLSVARPAESVVAPVPFYVPVEPTPMVPTRSLASVVLLTGGLLAILVTAGTFIANGWVRASLLACMSSVAWLGCGAALVGYRRGGRRLFRCTLAITTTLALVWIGRALAGVIWVFGGVGARAALAHAGAMAATFFEPHMLCLAAAELIALLLFWGARPVRR